MFDESTLTMPFLTGSLVLISLFTAWYRRVEPLLSFYLRYLKWSQAASIRRLSPWVVMDCRSLMVLVSLSLFAGSDIIYPFNFTRAVLAL